MSRNLRIAEIQSFDELVKQAYQGQAKIRPHVRTKTGVRGASHRFTTIGRGVATPRVPQTDVQPMNVGYTNATASIQDWVAPEFTDIFDQQKTNFDEQRQLAMVIATAIGRREDQLIIDALTAATPVGTVSADEGGTGTNLNTSKYRKAKQLLDRQGVMMMDRKLLVHANNIFGLLGDTTATSSDFATIRALVDGQVETWLGFMTLMFEDRDEGGLPVATNVRTGYAFHGGMMGSTGLAVGIDFRTEVNYVPEKTSWLANGLFAAGSVVIDPNGVVDVNMDETGV